MISLAHANHCIFGARCQSLSLESDPATWLMLLAGCFVVVVIIWIVETIRRGDE